MGDSRPGPNFPVCFWPLLLIFFFFNLSVIQNCLSLLYHTPTPTFPFVHVFLSQPGILSPSHSSKPDQLWPFLTNHLRDSRQKNPPLDKVSYLYISVSIIYHLSFITVLLLFLYLYILHWQYEVSKCKPTWHSPLINHIRISQSLYSKRYHGYFRDLKF